MAIDGGEYQNLQIVAKVDFRGKKSALYIYVRKIMMLISFPFKNLEEKPQSSHQSSRKVILWKHEKVMQDNS